MLESVTIDELEDALATVESKKPTQRLLFAILYKRGPSVPMIADWFDMREDTIYRWFRQIEDEPILDAVHDDPRPGRPPKLTADQRRQFVSTLQSDPADVGYDAPAWTTSLARRYLREEFDVQYTARHVRRLLKDRGFRLEGGELKSD